MRTLHQIECVLKTMHWVLNTLTDHDPAWVEAHVPPAWFERYGLRADRMRFPKDTSKRTALATTIGQDGATLLDWLAQPATPHVLRDLHCIAVMRMIWMQQFYRCTIPGAEQLRLRTMDEKPATAHLIQSPYDVEARYSSKRDTVWNGYKVHLTESCDDGYPDLIVHVATTSATTQDFRMGASIQDAVAAHGLTPAIHLMDGGYVDSHLLVHAQQYDTMVIGPTFGSYSRQRREDHGFALAAFAIHWEAQTVQCPQGQMSVKWTPGQTTHHGKAACRACSVRAHCTAAKDEPRQRTLRPQQQHHALYDARAREQTAVFKHQLRAGVESTMAQGALRFGIRRSRWDGLGQCIWVHAVFW